MPQVASTVTAIVGDTGTGKTSLLATMAEWVWRRHKKVTRLVSFDGGGYGARMQALIEKGIVEVYKARSRDPDGNLGLPTGTCAYLTQGCWPKERDPLTGLGPLGVDLIRPTTTWFSMLCTNGHVAKRAMTDSMLTATPCPACKTLTTKEKSGGVRREILPTQGFEHVGAVAFDSATSMSDWCMTDVSVRAGRDELGGEKGSIKPVASSGLIFGTAGRGGVGFVQNRAQDWINNANAIPGLVVPAVFTFLELRASDENANIIYGPKLVGVAKTPEIPSWVGNCLGTTHLTNADGKLEFRLYLRPYQLPGEQGLHLVKTRAGLSLMPEYLADPPEVAQDRKLELTQFNLGVFFDLLEQALEVAKSDVAEAFPDAPGLGDGKVGGGASVVGVVSNVVSNVAGVSRIRPKGAAVVKPAETREAAPDNQAVPSEPAQAHKVLPPAAPRLATPPAPPPGVLVRKKA